MYSKCFRQLDLDDNLIGELGGFEIMRALSKRDQRMCLCNVNARRLYTSQGFIDSHESEGYKIKIACRVMTNGIYGNVN